VSFTIDELEVVVDNQSNPVWFINDNRCVHLHPEQECVARTMWLARSFGWEINLTPGKAMVVDGDLLPVSIPIRKSICTRCRGKGTMANPAFNGTSIEWWQEHGGPDWEEDLDEYMNGDMYDVECEYNCSSGIAWSIDWQRVIDLYRVYGEEEKANEWINAIYGVLMDWHEGEEEAAAERRYFASFEG
jgi:hypothetical protein